MDREFIFVIKKFLEGNPNAKAELTLDEGSIFATSKINMADDPDITIISAETLSSPSELVFFDLSRIHHIVLKSRDSKKISFRSEDLLPPNKPQGILGKNHEKQE
jgi:hypothetical protein